MKLYSYKYDDEDSDYIFLLGIVKVCHLKGNMWTHSER